VRVRNRVIAVIVLVAALAAVSSARADDIVFAGRGDAAGYHLFKARASEGWAWRPITTIQPGGQEADAWTGYQCATADGRWIVSVVAPRAAANNPVARDRGAIAYVTSVSTGRTRPLVAGVALKYYSPACAIRDRAVLTSNNGSDQASTTLLVADLASARITRQTTVRRQLTSPTLAGDGRLLAAAGDQLVRVRGHRVQPVHHAAGQRAGRRRVARRRPLRPWLHRVGRAGSFTRRRGISVDAVHVRVSR
jgi:hypothetical protein